MYFAGDDGYRNFLVFAPMHSSLTMDSNKIVAKWISTGISNEKFKPFYTNLAPIMFNLANSFLIKNCLFGTVKLVRNAIESKFIYKVQGIAFDGEGLWNFSNDFAGNVVIFGVDRSSSSHTDNRKNTF